MTFRLFEEDFEKVTGYTGASGSTGTRDYRKAIDYLGSVRSKYKRKNASKRSAYHYYLALYHSKLGNYTAADKHFDSAIGDMSGRHQIAIERATSYLQRGALKEANEILEELEKNRGIQNVSLYRLFCKIKSRYHILSGNYQSALDLALQSNCLDKHTDPTPIKETDLAKRLLKNGANPLEGSFEYAVGLLALDIKSNSHIKLSYIFLETLMKPLENPEDTVECYVALSRFAERLDDVKRAKIYIDKAIALSPENVELRADRIRLSCQNGNADEALKFYNQDKDLIKTYPTAALAVMEAFNTACKISTFEGFKHNLATIATSLAKHLAKQGNVFPRSCLPVRAYNGT